MLKFVIPAILVFLIILFWEKINEKIYKKFQIKVNYILIIIFCVVIVVIIALLYF